ERHVATLSNSLGDPEGNADGRHPSAAGTRYAAPLRILYKSDDPSQVMAVADAEEFAADTAAPSVISGVIALAGTTTIAVAVSSLAYARLQSGPRQNRQSRRRTAATRGRRAQPPR
ncbi:MAG TPA: hypothetical protein VG497_31305, partial [Kribbella sp.]|nr:hypothetical protein [Kribbella sp.]